VTLYAQVDSSGVIAESDETDNIWGAGLTQCLAAEDAYEDDNFAAAAPAFPLGASQARTIGGPGDEDWSFVELQANHFYQAVTSGLSAGLDAVLTIFNPDGASVLTSNDDLSSTSLASQTRFAPPTATTTSASPPGTPPAAAAPPTTPSPSPTSAPATASSCRSSSADSARRPRRVPVQNRDTAATPSISVSFRTGLGAVVLPWLWGR
jgi:hypothetical protein